MSFKIGGARKGFSLMEVVVAVLIFALGILAIIGNLPWLLDAEKNTEMRTTAGILAERYMGQIQADDNYDQLDTLYNDTPSSRRAIPNFPEYQACLKVENADYSSYGDDLKKITVIIYWKTRGNEHSYTLVNLRAAQI